MSAPEMALAGDFAGAWASNQAAAGTQSALE